jgi:hypothetical protein
MANGPRVSYTKVVRNGTPFYFSPERSNPQNQDIQMEISVSHDNENPIDFEIEGSNIAPVRIQVSSGRKGRTINSPSFSNQRQRACHKDYSAGYSSENFRSGTTPFR